MQSSHQDILFIHPNRKRYRRSHKNAKRKGAFVSPIIEVIENGCQLFGIVLMLPIITSKRTLNQELHMW